MNSIMLSIAVAVTLLLMARILWIVADIRQKLDVLSEKAELTDMDVRYIHRQVVPPGTNPRYPEHPAFPGQPPRRIP